MQSYLDRILITGANGFVGRHLIRHIWATYPGAEIAATALPHELEDAARWSSTLTECKQPVKWCATDFCAPEQFEQLVSSFRPSSVCHLAARASGAETDRDGVFAVNVQGTKLLLEITAGARVLLISTGYAYGNTSPERPAIETDSLAEPGKFGVYTDSKIEMEHVAIQYSDRVIIARSFSHTGPGQTPAFVVPAFARQLSRVEKGLDPPIVKVGNLDSRRDIMDVRDVVRAYALLLSSGETGCTYNVATGNPYCIREVLDRLRGMISVKTEIVTDAARMRPADIACSTGNPGVIEHATGWSAQIPLETTLLDTMNWWRTRSD